MTNSNIFNPANSPVYTQLTNTFSSPGIESTPEGGAAAAGSSFILTTGSVSVGAGLNLLLQVVNATSSGRTLYVSRISGGATAAATLIVYSGGTITGGTTPAPVNTLLGNANASVMTTRQNTSTLTGTSTSLLSIPLTAGMYWLNLNGSIIVPPGQTLTISVGTGSQTAAINLSWWEF
ncbi:hypothetical protein [Paenibacillus sp. OK003]|uniref:hypothetical protein n=1 Tax=Paenibacillus sp. OK003 TaxID=1884380 RepID=UPI0008B6B6A7|nr:hypothetical protein [Paenibacillus sp. OK003]SEK46836.1 hypothetical protein SAMN05518856_102256 [Paenibacillus sp. OK003]